MLLELVLLELVLKLLVENSTTCGGVGRTCEAALLYAIMPHIRSISSNNLKKINIWIYNFISIILMSVIFSFVCVFLWYFDIKYFIILHLHISFTYQFHNLKIWDWILLLLLPPDQFYNAYSSHVDVQVSWHPTPGWQLKCVFLTPLEKLVAAKYTWYE